MEKKTLVKILVSLMKIPSSCPSFKGLSRGNFKDLLKIAELNKATTFLSHFLDCKKCQQKLTSNGIKRLGKIYNATLAHQMIRQRERILLGKTFRQKHLKVLILKDFSFYPKLYRGKTFITSGDIDLLVKRKDFKKVEETIKELGYSLKENLILKNPIDKKTFFYQEKSFVKKRGFLTSHVDLHLWIAIPGSGEFKPISKKVIREVTSDIAKHSIKRKDCLFEPELEYFLLSLIVHYFSSDLCTSLRNLYDIIMLAKLYEKEIDWKKFWQIVKRSNLERIVLFVLLLGSRIFKIEMPKGLKQQTKFSYVLKALAAKKKLQSIAIFPPNTEWQKKTPAMKKLFREDFFFKVFLTKNVRLTRLMRPRIISFFLSSLIRMPLVQFENFFNHQQKLF